MKEVVVERRRRFNFFLIVFFRSRLLRRLLPRGGADVVPGVGDASDVVLEAADEGGEAIDGEDGLLLEEGVAGGGRRIRLDSILAPIDEHQYGFLVRGKIIGEW